MNFWIKNLTSIHEDLAQAYNDIVKNPEKCPKWLTQGITYLLPKTTETSDPKNYRPITCLPTMCKILTSIIAERTYNFLEKMICYQQSRRAVEGETKDAKTSFSSRGITYLQPG